MPTTVRTIVSSVITELSQVPGVATQIYASGRIQQHVQDALLLEFEDFWWPDYMSYFTVALDGTDGFITTSLTNSLGSVSEWRDIHSVWPEGDNRKLVELPQSINPTTVTSGGRVRYVSPDYTTVNRPLRVWPADATGNIVVWGKRRPTLPINLDDNVYIDPLLLQYDATWMYAVDDGTIPAQVNKFQVLAQNRRKTLKASFSQQPIPLDPRYSIDDTMNGFDDSYFTVGVHPLA